MIGIKTHNYFCMVDVSNKYLLMSVEARGGDLERPAPRFDRIYAMRGS